MSRRRNPYGPIGISALLISCGGSTTDLSEAEDSLYADLMDHGSALESGQTMSRTSSTVGAVTLLSTEVVDYPESSFSAGAYIVVSGPASYGIPPGQPGLLTLHKRFSDRGELVGQVSVPYPSYLPPGAYPNALSVAVPGALGDVYVNSILTGIYRVNTLLGWSEQYTTGPVPDIPPCHVSSTEPCSRTSPCPDPPIPGSPTCTATMGRPPLNNSLVLTEDGTFYSSDSLQASIWTVPSGSRQYELWISSELLQGNVASALPAGANGLTEGPDGYIYVTNTTGGPELGGAIYRIPKVADPQSSDIELVASYAPMDIPGEDPLPQGPDGLRFDVNGNLWVTFSYANAVGKLTFENGVVVDEQRFTYDPPVGGIPWHQPSELHLDSRQRLAFFSNHALEPPTPEHHALFSLDTGVRGAPLSKPWLGWDCQVQDCDIDWQSIDEHHLAELVFEELTGL